MRSSTAEMVEKKVLEMAQHASFHQHVSYNLSTILHALTAGKTDPAEIAEAFSRAKGLEVITRVVSGEPVARPPVVGLCCAVARRVVDKYGNGVAEEQAGGLVEAVVIRLGRGISGDDAQAVECQVECARLMCTMAGRAASVLTGGGALAAIEGMLERLGGKHSSIMRPCCEALERVSRTEDGRTVFEERGTGGVLLATIRDFPEALEEGSDAALAAALKVVERIFTGKSPEACILSLRARAEEESTDDPHVPTTCDYSSCVETVLAVAEATPEAPGAAAATCLWWLSGASSVASDRALSSLLTAAVAAEPGDEGEGEGGKRAIGEGGGERKDADSEAVAKPTTGDVWSWFPRRGGEEEEDEEEGEVVTDARPLEAARFLATLCLYRPGLKVLEAGVRRKEPHALEALLRLSASDDPRLARACFRILERLGGRGSSIGAQTLVDAGTLEVATEAGKRFEVVVDVEEVHDDEANAIAAALGTVAVLAEAGGASARPVIDEAFQLSVRCLGRVGEFSGRPAAAAAKAALDVITFRLTRPDRPKGPAVTRPGGVSLPSAEDGVIAPGDSGGRDEEADKTAAPAIEKSSSFSVGDYAVDTPMEVLKDADAILAAMKAHPSDARVQQSGWKSLLAMDTGRGGSQRAVPGAGDGYQSRRQMLRDCLERHGGESLVAGQVADILDGLGLHTDSDGEQSLTASLSDHPHGEDSPRPRTDGEDSLPTAVDGGGVENESGGVSPQGPDIKGKKESHEFSSERAPVAGDTGAATTTTTTATDPAVEAPSEAEACASGEGREGDDAEQPLEVPVPEKPASGEGVGVVEVVKGGEGDCNNAGVEEAVGDGEADGDVEGSAQGDAGDDGTGTEGLSSDDVAVDDMEEHRPVEDVLAELSLSGQKALEGSDTSSPGAPPAFGDHLLPVSGGSPSIGRSNIIRSLFSDDDGQGEEGGGEEGEEEEEEEVQREMGAEENEQDVEEDASVESLPVPVVPSKDEIELQSSWAELERLYGDVLGRSHILGGESAETVAAMPDPSVLREGIGAMLEGADGGKSRDAFATMSLAMVGALTAATGALACSQKEVQRYLKMSRDLRETSTWKDISEAMQWTMDSLKGTVILFTPHTGQGLTRDLGLCKNMESASKLFKEAALQIKIVVVELAGEHQVNTVWRIGPGIFEGLPDKRKIMVLRQLRSLVVAYDHLSDDRRKELTTALEIIKNREVLNRMGKCCVQAEALDEKRREAKLASADDRLRVGTRRPSCAFTPPSGKDSPGSYANKFSATTTTTPGSSRKGAHESPRSVRSTDSASTGAATSVSGGTSVSGAASATGSTSVTGATTSTTGATTSATGANTSTTGATTSATGSTTSATSGAAAGGSGIPRARGAAFTPRRRDSVAQQQQQQRAPRSRSPVTRLARSMATPASRSKSPMPRSGRSIPSPSPRSRSPVPRSARSAASPAASRSKSPVPGTARSRQSLASPASTPRSPVPRPRGSKPSGSKPLPRSPAPRSKLGLTASPQLALGS